MNKLELIRTLSIEAGIPRPDAKRIVEIMFDSMADTLARGDRVEIRGFCSFFVKDYKSYMGRNPKTGEKVRIPEKRLPFFKTGKELRKRINGNK